MTIDAESWSVIQWSNAIQKAAPAQFVGRTRLVTIRLVFDDDISVVRKDLGPIMDIRRQFEYPFDRSMDHDPILSVHDELIGSGCSQHLT